MFRKILLPVDGSETSRLAAEQGLALATLHEAAVVLLAVRVPVPIIIPPAGFVMDAPIIYKEVEVPNQKVLDGLEQRARERGLAVKTLIRSGDPAREILAVVDAEHAGLMIMDAHAHGW